MDNISSKSTLLLTGEYQHAVESKGRVLIPNKLRSQIDVDEHGSGFYLVLGASGILCLYPENYLEQKILLMFVASDSTPHDEAVELKRICSAMSYKVELDSQGRVLLNKKMRERAGLKGEITLIGVRDHIELWNSEDWEQYVSDHKPQYLKHMSQIRQILMQDRLEEL